MNSDSCEWSNVHGIRKVNIVLSALTEFRNHHSVQEMAGLGLVYDSTCLIHISSFQQDHYDYINQVKDQMYAKRMLLGSQLF